jgi:hypothetical protein
LTRARLSVEAALEVTDLMMRLEIYRFVKVIQPVENLLISVEKTGDKLRRTLTL